MEHKVITISANRLNEFQACLRKHYFSGVLHLSPMQRADYLDKGDTWHRMLEGYYNAIKDGKKFPEAVAIGRAKHIEAIQDLDLEGDAVKQILDMYQEYVNYYQSDGWNPTAVEAPFSTVLGEIDVLGIHYTVLFEGKIDLTSETSQGLLVVDHKTASSKRQPPTLSNQNIGYTWATGTRIMCINQAIFKKGPDKFHRYILNYTKEIQEEWRVDSLDTVRRMIEADVTNYYPGNYTSCDKFGGCHFRSLCESTPDSREWKMQVEYIKREAHDLFKKENSDES